MLAALHAPGRGGALRTLLLVIIIIDECSAHITNDVVRRLVCHTSTFVVKRLYGSALDCPGSRSHYVG